MRYIFCLTTDDDGSSSGVAIAISIVVTFIITLVVIAPIVCIITTLYYKHKNKLKKKIAVDNTNTEPKNLYGDNFIMDSGPAYDTTTTIKMDDGPVYSNI